jgi:NAD(P)-dependent dehydrogenase (short-subunit alcohol dehydrogenase family)
MQMKGLVTIVTGASRGLGRAIANEYAREGARVVVTARPSSPTGLAGTAQETAQGIQAAGGESLAVPCDVADEEQVRAMVRQVMDRYGRIDVLVNNAGLMIPCESLFDIEPARFDELMAVNVRGVYLVCREVLPVMIRQRQGNVINVGSAAARNARAGGTAYGASKAAVHMFTFCLAEEMREHDIAVNVLDPGGLKSEGSGAIAWARGNWHTRIDPEDVGPCAVVLALQRADTFTGQVAAQTEFGKTWP